ncbi:MAG: hypothetical protein ABH823_00540 [bacterium]
MGETVVGEVTTWCSVKSPLSYKSFAKDKKELLKRLKDDPDLQRMSRGERTYTANSGRNPTAQVALLQQALYAIGLLDVSAQKSASEDCWMFKFQWGIYTDATKKAVAELQEYARVQGGERGRKFGKATLKALKTAVESGKKGAAVRLAF